MRIVSLLPSATETLAAIGGSSFLVGRSADCDHPPEIRSAPALTGDRARSGDPAETDRLARDLVASGGLETLDADALGDLKPDLVLLQDRCGVCSVDPDLVQQALSDAGLAPRLLFLNVQSVEGMLDAAIAIGEAAGLEQEAEAAVATWRDRLHSAMDLVTPYAAGPRTAVLEWVDPLFVGGSWIPQLVERAGGEHPLLPTAPLPKAGAGAGAHGAHRVAPPSKAVAAEELANAAIETLIVAPCGEPASAAMEQIGRLSEQPWWSEIPAVRAGRVYAADGRLLSRPGPRLVDAQGWLVSLLADRPEADPGTVECRRWRA
jgi:iron complex transport system substrate-binding protein